MGFTDKKKTCRPITNAVKSTRTIQTLLCINIDMYLSHTLYEGMTMVP